MPKTTLLHGRLHFQKRIQRRVLRRVILIFRNVSSPRARLRLRAVVPLQLAHKTAVRIYVEEEFRLDRRLSV